MSQTDCSCRELTNVSRRIGVVIGRIGILSVDLVRLVSGNIDE